MSRIFVDYRIYSQRVFMHILNEVEVKDKWEQKVESAKVFWEKLTEDELLNSEGNTKNLYELIQERYGVTREKAEKQVGKFIDIYKNIEKNID
jgi:uncharacterized protein YjbJ (UPF0337 family)